MAGAQVGNGRATSGKQVGRRRGKGHSLPSASPSRTICALPFVMVPFSGILQRLAGSSGRRWAPSIYPEWDLHTCPVPLASPDARSIASSLDLRRDVCLPTEYGVRNTYRSTRVSSTRSYLQLNTRPDAAGDIREPHRAPLSQVHPAHPQCSAVAG